MRALSTKPGIVPRATSRPITVADVLSFHTPRPLASLTFGELAAAFVHQAKLDGRDLPHYGAPLRDHLLPAFGHLEAREVTSDLIAAWVRALLSHGYAQGTVASRLSLLGTILRHGVGLGVLDRNPVRDLPSRPSRAPVDPGKAAGEVLSLEQVRAVLGALEDEQPELRVVLSTLMLTGARVGEASALTWGDLRAVGPLHQLRIERSWSCRRQCLASTKTGAARSVPVHARLLALLETWRREQRHRLRRPVADTDLICPRTPLRWFEGGVYWGQTTLLRRWHEVLERAGVAHPATGPRRLHAARHTFASLLVRAGAAERSVRAITHDSTADGSTFSRYVHLDWPSLCEAVLKLEV
jgi:integrase